LSFTGNFGQLREAAVIARVFEDSEKLKDRRSGRSVPIARSAFGDLRAASDAKKHQYRCGEWSNLLHNFIPLLPRRIAIGHLRCAEHI
jgi:hypothetical protein